MNEWKDIDTAPKDEFFVCLSDSNVLWTGIIITSPFDFNRLFIETFSDKIIEIGGTYHKIKIRKLEEIDHYKVKGWMDSSYIY